MELTFIAGHWPGTDDSLGLNRARGECRNAGMHLDPDG
jgi:hypothetical protein